MPTPEEFSREWIPALEACRILADGTLHTVFPVLARKRGVREMRMLGVNLWYREDVEQWAESVRAKVAVGEVV